VTLFRVILFIHIVAGAVELTATRLLDQTVAAGTDRPSWLVAGRQGLLVDRSR
jgi:hypothetical protein